MFQESVGIFLGVSNSGLWIGEGKLMEMGGEIDTSLSIHTLPGSSKFDGPNPIPTIGL